MMDELRHEIEDVDASEVVSRAQESDRRNERCGNAGENPWDQVKILLHYAEELEKKYYAHRLRRGRDRLYLGLLCSLGVVSLIGAWISGIWEPVGLGLGICLTGGAAVLLYQAKEMGKK